MHYLTKYRGHYSIVIDQAQEQFILQVYKLVSYPHDSWTKKYTKIEITSVFPTSLIITRKPQLTLVQWEFNYHSQRIYDFSITVG